jgi:phage baseplate assembly protein gpV
MKIFIALSIAAMLAGCVRVQFVSKDGTQVTYTRFLMNADKVEGNVGDNKVSVGSSTVSVEALTQMLQAIPR